MTLFDIGTEFQALNALLDETDGEITPESEAAYDALFAEIARDQSFKLDAYVHLQKLWEGEAAVAQAVVDQFKKKVSVLENRVKRHKQRMLDYLTMTQQVKAKTTTGWELAVTKNGGLTPVKYDEFARLMERGFHLRIR